MSRGWLICVDTGGTFTDGIARDPDGRVRVHRDLGDFGRLRRIDQVPSLDRLRERQNGLATTFAPVKGAVFAFKRIDADGARGPGLLPLGPWRPFDIEPNGALRSVSTTPNPAADYALGRSEPGGLRERPPGSGRGRGERRGEVRPPRWRHRHREDLFPEQARGEQRLAKSVEVGEHSVAYSDAINDYL